MEIVRWMAKGIILLVKNSLLKAGEINNQSSVVHYAVELETRFRKYRWLFVVQTMMKGGIKKLLEGLILAATFPILLV